MTSKINSNVQTKIWNAAFISVFITNVLMQLGQQMCNSLVAKYADYLGATSSLVGLVSSVFAITALIFKFFSAPAIDSFNRKYVLAGAMSILGIAIVGYMVSKSIPMLVVSRLIQGVGNAFTTACCLTLASDALPAEKMGTGIGYFSMASAVSQAIGPTIALKCLDAMGYNNTFAVAAACMFTGAFIATQIKIDYHKTKEFKISIKSMIAKEAITPAIVMFFLCMVYSTIHSFLLIYADKQGVDSNIGLFFTVYAVTLLFSRPLVGRLTDKYNHVKVLIPALVCFAGAFAIISVSQSLWMFLVAAFVSAFGFGASQPVIQSLVMKLVPQERRGAGSVTSFIGNDSGILVGPLVAGFVEEQFGYSAMWRIMTIPIFAAMIFVVVFRKKFTIAPKVNR